MRRGQRLAGRLLEQRVPAHGLAGAEDLLDEERSRLRPPDEAAGARVERAMEILGDDVPEHLRMAGELRLANKQASLDELGRLSDPVLTKDAIAGRIRRLLAMADRRAEELGIAGTEGGEPGERA